MSLMNESLDIFPLVQTEGQAMGIDYSIGVKVATTSCNIQPVGATDVEEMQRLDIRASYKIFTNDDLEVLVVGGVAPNITKGLNINYVLHDPVRDVYYNVVGVIRRHQPQFKTSLQWKIYANVRVL